MGSAGQADVEGRELSDQPWGGRFGEEPDPLIDRFTRSLAVDSRLFREDIAGSRAYAKALVGAGVMTADEQSRIDQALQEIETDLQSELTNHPPPLAAAAASPSPLAGEGRVGAPHPPLTVPLFMSTARARPAASRRQTSPPLTVVIDNRPAPARSARNLF